MKDPSEREIPIQFADEDYVCEHGKLKNNLGYIYCKECFYDKEVDYLIEIKKEKENEQ
tara:strand:+ start:193 stop:366 length:174 start_codon:yes stop_codon:yes gene_type:complete